MKKIIVLIAVAFLILCSCADPPTYLDKHIFQDVVTKRVYMLEWARNGNNWYIYEKITHVDGTIEWIVSVDPLNMED